MNKKTLVHYIFIVLTILTALLIFLLSSENAEKSSETSGRVVRLILSILVKDYSSLNETEKEELVGRYSYFIRKLAHFSEYALFGFFLFAAMMTQRKSPSYRKCIPLSLLFSFLYAVSDELHQNFSSGRFPSFCDVLLDTSGAFSGIMLAFLLLCLCRKRK